MNHAKPNPQLLERTVEGQKKEQARHAHVIEPHGRAQAGKESGVVRGFALEARGVLCGFALEARWVLRGSASKLVRFSAALPWRHPTTSLGAVPKANHKRQMKLGFLLCNAVECMHRKATSNHTCLTLSLRSTCLGVRACTFC